MATVRLDAGEFYYVSYGDRAGMPLVLLHGMPSDCSTWAQVAPGHAVHRTRPTEFLATTTPFLRRILPGRTILHR